MHLFCQEKIRIVQDPFFENTPRCSCRLHLLPKIHFSLQLTSFERSPIEMIERGKSPNEVELDLSKTQLASKLGTISETLSMTLTKMKAKG